MAKSEEEIKREIRDFIVKNDGRYSSWHVGISEDPRRRLFDEHKVRRKRVRGFLDGPRVLMLHVELRIILLIL